MVFRLITRIFIAQSSSDFNNNEYTETKNLDEVKVFLMTNDFANKEEIIAKLEELLSIIGELNSTKAFINIWIYKGVAFIGSSINLVISQVREFQTKLNEKKDNDKKLFERKINNIQTNNTIELILPFFKYKFGESFLMLKYSEKEEKITNEDGYKLSKNGKITIYPNKLIKFELANETHFINIKEFQIKELK